MKKLIDTIKNIWSIKDLRQRILYTLGLLFVFRLGSYVVLPGVISSVLDNVASSRSPNDLLGLINTFTGGAFNQACASIVYLFTELYRLRLLFLFISTMTSEIAGRRKLT